MTSYSSNTIKAIPFNNQNCINFIKSSNYDWWISPLTGEFKAIVPKKFNIDGFKAVPMSAKEQTTKITKDIDFIRTMKNEILNLSPIV